MTVFGDFYYHPISKNTWLSQYLPTPNNRSRAMKEVYPQSDSEKPWPWPPWTYSGCKVHSQSFSKISAISNQISTLLVALIKEGLGLAMVSRPMVSGIVIFYQNTAFSAFISHDSEIKLLHRVWGRELCLHSVSLWRAICPLIAVRKNIDAKGIQDLWLLMRATGAHAPFRLSGLDGTSTQTLRSLRMHLCSSYVFIEVEQMALFMSVSRNPGSRSCP